MPASKPTLLDRGGARQDGDVPGARLVEAVEHTKRPLHRAKAEPLVGAVLAAQNPKTGIIDYRLTAGDADVYHRFSDNHGEMVRDLDEFARQYRRIVGTKDA